MYQHITKTNKMNVSLPFEGDNVAYQCKGLEQSNIVCESLVCHLLSHVSNLVLCINFLCNNQARSRFKQLKEHNIVTKQSKTLNQWLSSQ